LADRLDLEQLRAAMGHGWKDWHYGDSLHGADDGALDTILGAVRFLLSVLDEGASLVVEKRCDMHGTIVHKWHPSAEKRAEYAQGCPGGYRKVVWPTEEEEE